MYHEIECRVPVLPAPSVAAARLPWLDTLSMRRGSAWTNAVLYLAAEAIVNAAVPGRPEASPARMRPDNEKAR